LGFRDGFKKRRQKKKEKESAPEPEKPREPVTEKAESTPEPVVEKAEEPTPEPVTEETEELTPEPPDEKIDEPTPEAVSEAIEESTSEPVADETENLAPKPPAEKIEEPTSEPIAEETEVASEPSTQETKELTPKPMEEETQELAPEPLAEKAEEPIPERRRLGFRGWFKKRRQKKKESVPEPEKPREPPTEEAEQLTPEIPTQEAKEPILEPIAKEKEELAPEIPTQETKELTPKPMEEETQELAPEPLAEKAEEPIPERRRLGFRGWFKKRRQKKKESVPEPEKPREPPTEEAEELTPELPAQEIEESTPEPITEEYQIFVNCEYSKWLGMFKDIGLETEVTVKTAFQKEAPLETRIDQVKEVLERGRSLAKEVIKVADQIYEVMRSYYDPDLPEENQSIAFAQKRLDEKAPPWTALNVLFASLNNWYKQYKVQIFKSVDPLQKSLTSIANLSTKNERLLSVFDYNLPIIMENAKKAENLKIDVEKNTFNVINVLKIRDVFQSSLSIVRDILSILYEKLKSKEKAIEILAPSEDFLWEKNDDLMKRMASAMEITSNSSENTLSQVLESLPKFLSYIDECIKTIALYNYTEELLLNYPIAERAVENLLSEKKCISAEDLPFEPKYAEEYLKLFYSQKFREFSLDKTNMLLMKKT
jgi:hypothetical protein